jgi:hypothetical protein
MNAARKALLALTSVSVALASPGSAMPDFVPSPAGIYEDFTGLAEPKAELPLGALWVQGYGPTGEGAAADNLLTIKSLNNVTLDRNAQVNLFAGILNLVGVDPSYRSRVSIRLGNITIVRVKDLAQLSGPAGEPRLYEALKAGTVTITTENDLGLGVSSRVLPDFPVTGRGDAGRRRSFSIDGSDLFIAYRVVTLTAPRGKEVEVPIRRIAGGAEAVFEPYRITMDSAQLDACLCGSSSPEQADACPAANPVHLSIGKLASAQGPGTARAPYTLEGPPVALALPVPIADGRGGLHTAISLRLDLDLTKNSAQGAQCLPAWGRKSRLAATLHGTRLETLNNAQAPGW